MIDVTLMTAADEPANVLPSLTLLPIKVSTVPFDISSLTKIADNSILLIDACENLVGAKNFCNMIKASGLVIPIVLILNDGGFTVVDSDWEVCDMILKTAGPAEIDARLRIVNETWIARLRDFQNGSQSGAVAGSFGGLRGGTFAASRGGESGNYQMPADYHSNEDSRMIRCGCVCVDTEGYTATLHGKTLDLTFKEFELLKYFALNPGHVFTRSQLLREVWGCDYYGGTRTVDVHIRRLRAKLGSEYDFMISTVRNVGYRFDAAESADPAE